MDTSAAVKPALIIAVIDDDKGMRDAIVEILELDGYAGRGFASAASFLAIEPLDPCDCIISILRMPGIDGVGLQRRLNLAGSRIPIVFVSSYDRERTRLRALDAGAISVLRKPVSAAELTDAVHLALGIGARILYDDSPGMAGADIKLV
ncbi:FixJ family two-component response regulator [Novosphingobium chloroacetimidivorans]|uniref:FixJ family two-component response regulator n=1 Tax=Novosphingobium chloroacetimidivorans TaxID=1428314 RepID=A0A7W7KD02_9SPHN|nr:response regulator [Novosphingobium chloroacetimidivorans]MBB4860562.1 FixJ family two-component response regulator [Novosphingobium chloroacetimidivorans]